MKKKDTKIKPTIKPAPIKPKYGKEEVKKKVIKGKAPLINHPPPPLTEEQKETRKKLKMLQIQKEINRNFSKGMLNFYGKDVGNYGVEAIAQAIPKLTGLVRLRLGYSGIGVEGAKVLSDALPYCKQLEGLLLGGITYRVDMSGDCIYSFTGDEPPTYCKQVDFTSKYKNYFYTDGTIAIAKAIKSLPELVCLDLQGCNVTHEAMGDVVEAANSCDKLATVWLANNPKLVGKKYGFRPKLFFIMKDDKYEFNE